MNLRLAREADFEAIMEIYEANVLALREMGIDQWQGEDRPTIEEIRSYICDSLYVLEDRQGGVLGVVKVTLTPYPDYEKEPKIWSFPGPYASIGRLGILPDAKRQGLGLHMIESAEDMMLDLGAKAIRVDTHPGNHKMLALLRKAGYKEAGIVNLRGKDKRIAFEKSLDVGKN